MILPAVTQALRDGRLRPTDYRVYGYCLEYLDLVEFRPLKARACAEGIAKRRQHVAWSLRRLTTLGYLEAAPQLDGHTRAYRIRLSVQGLGQNKAA